MKKAECPVCGNEMQPTGMMVNGQMIPFDWRCDICYDMAREKLEKHKQDLGARGKEAIREFRERMSLK